MTDIFECAERLGVDMSISESAMSFSERERLKICLQIQKENKTVIDASIFDSETLNKIVTYLKEKNIKFLIINT